MRGCAHEQPLLKASFAVSPGGAVSDRGGPGATHDTDVIASRSRHSRVRTAAPSASTRRRLRPSFSLEALEIRTLLADVGNTLMTAQMLGRLGPDLTYFDNQQGLGDGGTADVDLYKFTALAGESLYVSSSTMASPVRTRLRLFDSVGNEINGYSYVGTSLVELGYEFTQDGDYYIGVSGNPNLAYNPVNGNNAITGYVGAYTFFVGLTPKFVDDFDVDGFSATNGNIGPTDGSQYDFYSLLVPSFSGTPLFQVQADPSGTGNPILELFDQYQQPVSLTDSDPTVAGFGGFLPVNAGAYYSIRIHMPPGSSGGYQLQISLPNSTPVDDHGNSLATATALGQGDHAIVSAKIDDVGDVDAFSFTATTDTLLQVNADKEIGSYLDTVLEIRDSLGALLTQNDNRSSMTTNSQVSQFVAAGQTVYVQVRGQAISRGAYVLRIEADGASNSAANTTTPPLAANEVRITPARINATDDVDHYGVTATHAGTLIVRMNATALSSKVLTLLDASLQSTRGASGSMPMLELRQTVAAGEVIYVRVESPGQVGDYGLQLELDVGDIAPTALPLTLTSANGAYLATVAGNWDKPSDVDVYRIVTAVSGLLTLSQPPTGTFQLVNGNGMPISPFVTAGQTVFVQAAAGTPAGPYTLAVRLDQVQTLTPDASGLTLINGVLQGADDIDIYSYVAPVDGHLSINVSAFFGVDLRLFGPNGMPLGEPAPDRIDIDLQAGQLVYIGVHTFAQGGNYTISTQIGTGLDDFGNTSETAQLVSLDGQGRIGLSGQIEAAFDVDRFKFVAASAMTLSIDLRPIPGSPLDPVLRVFDTDGKLLASNDNSFFTSSSHLSLDLTAGQQVFIEASGYSSSVGGYRLDAMGGSASQFDDFGDTIAAATSIMLRPGLNPPLMGRIEEEFDTDVFSFIVPITGQLLIQQEAAPDSLLDPYLTVYNAAGVVIQQDDNSGPNRSARVHLAVVAGQQIFVQAGGYSTSSGNYAMRLVLTDLSNPPPPLRVDPGRITSLTETIGDSLEQDVFRIEVTADGLLTIRQQALPGSTLDPVLSVFTAAGVLQATNDNAGPGLSAAVTLRVVAGQQLLIRASGYGATTGTYQIDMEINDGVEDIVDLQPVTLSLSGETLQPGAIEFVGDTDLYQVAIPSGIPAGTVLLVWMESDGRGLDPVLSIFDSADLSTRQTLAYSDNDGVSLNSNVALSVTAGQTLFVQASGFGGTKGRFRLRFAFQTDDQPNTLTATGITALTLGSDRTVTQTGTINYNGDKDVFKYVATEQGQLRIYQQGVTPGFDSFLQVFNGRSTLLARNDDANGLDAMIDLFVQEGDVLLIQAGAFATSTGQYSLRIEQTFIAADDVPDTFDRATPFSLTGNTATLSATISSATDVDVFTFTAASSGTLSAQLQGLSGQIAVYELVDAEDDSSARLTQLVARNLSGDTATLQITQGRQYYVRVTGPTTGAYQVQLTQTEPSATSQALTDQEFEALVERARERYAETGDLELVLDELVVEYQRLVAQRGGTPGPVLLLVTDPVDFSLTASGQSQQVGYTGSSGRSLEIPQAQLSSDGILEVAIIPSASSSYQLQLQGVGSSYQVGARMVDGDTVQTASVSGQSSGSLSKSSSLQLALDFGATPTSSTASTSGLNSGQISAGTSTGSAPSLFASLTNLLPALVSSSLLTSTEADVDSATSATDAADTASAGSPSPSSVMNKALSLLKRASKTLFGNGWGTLYKGLTLAGNNAASELAEDSPQRLFQDWNQLVNQFLQMVPAPNAGEQPTANDSPTADDQIPAIPTNQESRPDGQAANTPTDADRVFAAYTAF